MKSKGHLKDIARMLVALLIFLMSGQAWAQGAYGYTVPPDWERAFDAHRNPTAPDKFAEQQSYRQESRRQCRLRERRRRGQHGRPHQRA